ncbi:MAG: hypothetical protein ACXWPM_00885 [Bdellovibrionota bacterium]
MEIRETSNQIYGADNVSALNTLQQTAPANPSMAPSGVAAPATAQLNPGASVTSSTTTPNYVEQVGKFTV